MEPSNSINYSRASLCQWACHCLSRGIQSLIDRIKSISYCCFRRDNDVPLPTVPPGRVVVISTISAGAQDEGVLNGISSLSSSFFEERFNGSDNNHQNNSQNIMNNTSIVSFQSAVYSSAGSDADISKPTKDLGKPCIELVKELIKDFTWTKILEIHTFQASLCAKYPNGPLSGRPISHFWGSNKEHDELYSEFQKMNPEFSVQLNGVMAEIRTVEQLNIFKFICSPNPFTRYRLSQNEKTAPVMQRVFEAVTAKAKEVCKRVLPTELHGIVLSYLNNKDIESTTTVSFYWNEAALNYVKGEESSKLEKISGLFETNLPEVGYVDLRKILSYIEDNRKKISKTCNLNAVKSLLDNVTTGISRCLIGSEDELRDLEQLYRDVPKLRFFEDIFSFVREDKKMKDRLEGTSKTERIHYYPLICKNLISSGRLYQADLIARQGECTSEIFSLYMAFAFRGEDCPLHRNSLIRPSVGPGLTISKILRNLALSLYESDRIDMALEVAHSPLLDDKGTEDVLSKIATTAWKKSKMYQALEVIEMISDNKQRDKAYGGICSYLCNSNNFDHALMVAKMISDNKQRDKAYGGICSYLCNSNNFDHALMVAKMISDSKQKDEAYGRICSCLCYNNNLGHALMVAKMMSDSKQKDETLRRICVDVGFKNFDQAI